MRKPQTQTLYLSDLLYSTKYENFTYNFTKNLDDNKILYKFCNNTKDIWMVDFMPVRFKNNALVKFRYTPDYLINSIVYRSTITDGLAVSDRLGLKPQISNLNIDGGNLIQTDKHLFMTEKVFRENPDYTRDQIVEELKNLSGLEPVFFEYDTRDKIAHADGYIRYAGNNLIILNEFDKYDGHYAPKLTKMVRSLGYDIVYMPCGVPVKAGPFNAIGVYINYLKINDLILVPQFGLKEDVMAIRISREIFIGCEVVAVNCKEIAKDGGVLNCISWII